MALPRTLFKFLSPMMSLVASTAGVNGPNLEFLPIVHFAAATDLGLQVNGAVNSPLRVTLGEPKTKAEGVMAVCDCCCWTMWRYGRIWSIRFFKVGVRPKVLY